MTAMTVEDVVRDRGSDVMHTIAAEASVAEAVALMARESIGAIVAMTEDQLVAGIFTERDLLKRVVAAGLDAQTTPLSMVMTREVRFVSPSTPVEAAMALMHVQRHRHLLVIDGPRVHGLVSMGDMVRQILLNGQGRFEAAVRAAGSESLAAKAEPATGDKT
jgi:signal-transduction protein with cAMP-binding, CBS, and nucleotidyltransferase domain